MEKSRQKTIEIQGFSSFGLKKRVFSTFLNVENVENFSLGKNILFPLFERKPFKKAYRFRFSGKVFFCRQF
ncbi:MAG: hypothetical protein IJY23_06500 [Clostridia bacterium]|nr:hypothetical protein [Clostridia bacterium]